MKSEVGERARSSNVRDEDGGEHGAPGVIGALTRQCGGNVHETP